ncbi:M23 family metallopeptidase [Arthrobacter echini]|uniref:M23 family metallopeptidase n=1 Tax=Arthrobacter echini TaxID=1529066 RepID=UPI0014561B93|nr:M23 family metallopeptidase [Arthrobacter echini]
MITRRAGHGQRVVRLIGSSRSRAMEVGIGIASVGILIIAHGPDSTAPSPAMVTTSRTAHPDSPDRAVAVTAADADAAFSLHPAGPPVHVGPPVRAAVEALPGATGSVESLAPPEIMSDSHSAFDVPVERAVLASSFGYRINPVTGVGLEFHPGLDYACGCGAAVTAVEPGTVMESGWHAYGGGLRVVIDHGGGLATTYNHLGVLEVPAGALIGRGELVGRVGSSGNSTGCHLHFEVLLDGDKVDPAPWF